jgi:2-keto-3-deoxy-L-rhamnonate aldolase RhmA
MSGKLLKEKLARGDTVFGTAFQYVTHPAMVEILPDKGLDFAIVTAEHNALDVADFLPLRWALAAKGIAVLARIHSRDPEDVSKICDTFDGVVVPYVEDVEQARRLAAAAVYRPLKGEALERVLSDGAWPSDKTRHYVTNVRSRDTVFVPMIESVRAVQNLDAVCAIPGVAAVLVGPNDLTVTMGIPDEYDHPDFVAIMQQIIDVAARHKVAAGCYVSRLDQAQRTVRQGARFVPYGSDLQFIREGLGHGLSRLSEKTGSA